MQIGIIGLGRMGGNIVRRLMKHGHESVVYDREPKAVMALTDEGAKGAGGLEELVRKLRPPRATWLMLPAGEITEQAIRELSRLLQPDDVVIDGGNTFWKDDIRRAAALKQGGLHYVDVGTRGGAWATCRDPRAEAVATHAQTAATSMPGRTALATSSRWSTTPSSMA